MHMCTHTYLHAFKYYQENVLGVDLNGDGAAGARLGVADGIGSLTRFNEVIV